MRVVSQITKDLVQDIFSKQNILTYMGARVARIELGEVDI